MAISPFFYIKSLFTGARLVSLPFSDMGGPLSTHPKYEEEILAEVIKEYGRKVKYIEVRSSLQGESGFKRHNYYKRFVMDLYPDPKALKKVIDKRTIQYSIRKAQKEGIQVLEDNTSKGIEEFRRLNLLTRKKHGVPSQPLSFFLVLHEKMVMKGLASVLLALHESKAVAGGLFFKFGDTVYYKYNASDPSVLSKITPNHLLTWAAIEKACAAGYRYFDFGRTSPDNEGLMRYKKMWAAEPKDLPYHYYPRISGAASQEENRLSYRVFTNLWRRLPAGVTDIIGPRLFRFFG